jgi:hypothetical protein
MTLIVSWIDMTPKQLPTVWTASDTELTDEERTLSLESSKVLELRIVCKNLSTPDQVPYYQSSIGFSYAGSTITAFNTYAMLATVFSNLGHGADLNSRPDHLSLISKAKDVLTFYTIDDGRKAQISLWGICPLQNVPFIGSIKWDITKRAYVTDIHLGEVNKLIWHALGQPEAISHLDKLINDKLKTNFDKDKAAYWRIPYYPLRSIIDSHIFKGVGGNIQLAMVNETRFNHMWVLTPPKTGSNNWNALYRNVDVFEMIGNRVGDCTFALSGMDMDYPHT